MAQWIISRSGVVYGSVVEYGANFRICHKRIDNITDLHLSQSSKYVHSKIDREIYLEVKKDLQDGKEVLFTGTGCQIAGVRNFLKKNYSNFYAVDNICHGVPSLKMLTDYLSSRYDVSQIRQISFRSKTGFNIYGVYGVKIDLPLPRNLYMMGFMKGLFYRPACYSCPFAQSQRGSDITLGDFWGLKAKFVDRPKTSKGTSVILINTEKGEKLLDVIKHDLALIERPIDEAIAGNPQLNHPSRRHYAYSFFRRLNPVLGFRTAAILSLVRKKIFYAFALPLLNKISGK